MMVLMGEAFMKSKEVILVVDDKEINRKMLCNIFDGIYETREAIDGQDAIEIIKREKDNICIILLDIIMPNIDGYGVLNFLQANNLSDDIPVIIITSDDSSETEKQILQYNVADYIKKPFLPAIILRRSKNIIDLYEHRKDSVDTLRKKVAELKEENRLLREKCKYQEELLSDFSKEKSENH